MPKLTMLTLNARGMKSKGFMDKALREFQKWKTERNINIATFQEHNLDPKDEEDLIRKAQLKNITLIIAFADKAPDGVHRGGYEEVCSSCAMKQR